MNLLRQIFGHKWRSGWAGARGGPFGAVVVILKTCNRCEHTEKEYSTATEWVLPKASETTEQPSEAAAEAGLVHKGK